MKRAHLLVPVALVACSTAPVSSGEAPPPQAAGAAETRGVVLGRIATRSAAVTMLGGRKDLRFVVRNDDGVVVADGVALEALEPELRVLVTSAVAERGTYLDATLDRSAVPRAAEVGRNGRPHP
jgi:hypothetical protein